MKTYVLRFKGQVGTHKIDAKTLVEAKKKFLKKSSGFVGSDVILLKGATEKANK